MLIPGHKQDFVEIILKCLIADIVLLVSVMTPKM